MKLKIERWQDANAIAEALAPLYPAYQFEARKWPRERLWSVAVFCRATGALLKSTAEV